ncbi:hypothetical protein ANN_10415 [Periplaneta americana]|uniref:ribonuclease H n=1 Tax=Periplaneta americana TaxID=6978 RepID=A0ABQ8TS42_PERAM|nr:hypothetical protein ANN_10415 [Periplaneta americana]
MIADALRSKNLDVHEEVHCIADGGSNCRIDIIAINKNKQTVEIIDPTIRFEISATQPSEVNEEKKKIYEPTIQYLSAKYNIEKITVTGLFFGARATIPKASVKWREKYKLTRDLQDAIVTTIIKFSVAIFRQHLYGVPIVLYACENWPLTLREEHRLRVFENKVLRKLFGAKRDEVIGEWRKLHNTELHALYSSPDIIRNIKSRRLRWAGHVARMGEFRNAYRALVGRPEGKRPLGRPRRRWEDNIKMELRDLGYDDREWINLAQDRDQWRAYVVAAMNLRYAILKALEQLEVLQQLKDVRKSAAIHTDSRITLDSLRNFNNHHHLIEHIRNQIRKLETLNWTIHFAWVKAHAGLAGNELADHLAKQAAGNNELPVSFDRIPVSDIMRELQEESVVKWESEWQNTINGAVAKSFFPSVKERLRVNIPLNGKVTTFLTGHGKTGAYLYRFKLRDNPSCACGAEEQTVDHLLFECPKLDKERLAFQREMLRKTGKLSSKTGSSHKETYAILKALEQLEVLQQLKDVRKSAAIHTDSRITLDSLRNFNNHHHLIEHIRKQIRKLETLNWTIHFAWVKAHAGLEGNELADHLAKQAASNNELPVSFDRILVSDIKRELQEESVVKWESEWQNTNNGAVAKSFFPSVKERLRVNIPLNGKIQAEDNRRVRVSRGTDPRPPPFRVPEIGQRKTSVPAGNVKEKWQIILENGIIAQGNDYPRKRDHRTRKRSGERGGQAIGPPLPIRRSGNLRSKYRRVVRLKCAGAPSCKK